MGWLKHKGSKKGFNLDCFIFTSHKVKSWMGQMRPFTPPTKSPKPGTTAREPGTKLSMGENDP